MKTALMLGTFDGVHIGHREVLSLPHDFKKIAVTFKKSPKSVITGKDEALVTFEDKCRILKEIGIDEIAPLEFDEVRHIKALDFLNMLYKKYNPSVICCGFNYNFGENGEGNTELLSEFCKTHGIELRCVSPVECDGVTVSSTVIRNFLKNGEIDKANNWLFEPFSFTAPVRHGDMRGRTIGFPTINQEYPKELVKLKFGVYKVLVIADGKEYIGIANIGTRPTYPIDEVISETFIKDFSGDLYEKNVKIVPLEFIREERKFNSLEELKKQIADDIKFIEGTV
jgi:riboflavin kinase/FMN adenylyltransferase